MPVKRKRSGKSGAPQARARVAARPSSSVFEHLDRIERLIASGLPRATAANMCGVTPQALADREREDVEVAARLAVARAQSEQVHLDRLDELIENGKPTAGLTWKIERLFKREWHIPTKIAMGQDPDAGPVKVEAHQVLSEDELRERARRLVAKIGSGS